MNSEEQSNSRHEKVEKLKTSASRVAVKHFVEVRDFSNLLRGMEGTLRRLVKLFRESDPEKYEVEMAKHRRRLVALHRLDICTDLHPDDPIDLVRLWLERTIILSMDGGGYYILWTMQLLKELERVANDETEEESLTRDNSERILCHELFDVVAGTSAGAVTAALIGKHWAARDIEKNFWQKKAAEIWPYRNPVQGAFLNFLLKNNLALPHYFWRMLFYSVDPPLVDKAPFRAWAKEVFGNETIEDFCTHQEIGIFLASKNVESGYPVPAGAILDPIRHNRIWCEPGHEKILVRSALEAAASPPLLMQPLGQYIDAGAGPDNDPTLTVLNMVYKLRKDRERRGKNAHQQRVRHPERQDTLRPEERMIEQLEILFWRITDKIEKAEKLSFQPKKTVTVFSFSTSFARVQRVPVKLAQKPMMPLFFWSDWIVNDFYLNSSMNPVRLLSDSESFPQLDYRRFSLTLGLVTLRDPLALGPYDTHFGRLPGISGHSTTTVTEEDLYYLRWLLETEFMPFYKAVGHSTVRYLRQRTRDLDAQKIARENGDHVHHYQQEIQALRKDCEHHILLSFFEKLMEDENEELLGVLFPKLIPQRGLTSESRQQIMLEELQSLVHSLVLEQDHIEGEGDEKQREEIFREHFIEKILPRRALKNFTESFHDALESPESEVMELAQAIGVPREKLEQWHRHLNQKIGAVKVNLPFENIEAWREELSAFSAEIWPILSATRKRIKHLREAGGVTRTAPAMEDPARINAFKYGLQGELMDYASNLYIEEQKQKAQEQLAEELRTTLGSPEWVDSQPTDGPRQGYFTMALPSLHPPYFQDHDSPLRHFNPFNKE